jgi:speckle-type POZ protein
MGLTHSKSAAGRGTTTSPIISETGSLTMHIAAYSQTKGIGVGKSINSSKFVVGGHSWYISYFPEDWVAVFLSLDTSPQDPHDDVVVTGAFQFSLLDGDCCHVFGRSAPAGSTFSFANGYSESWGFSKFIRRKKLGSPWWCYRRLGGEAFHIRCDVTMLSTDRPSAETTAASAPPPQAVVPVSDLHRHLGDILATGDRADVCFMVAGEPFLAHRSVLAARSSVLKEVLFDQDTPGTCIEVDNMDAGVFGAMLQFIYTDTLLPHIEEGNLH